MHRRAVLALLAVPALLAAATTAGCAGGDGSGSEPPTDAQALVLRLSELPGMLPLGGVAAIPPRFSLFGDGRLISVPTGSPGGWPQLREDRVPPDGVRDLFRHAVRLPKQAAAGGPDEPVVRVVVGSTDGQRTVTLPRADPAAARLRAALARYADGHSAPYQPTAVAIVATPSDSPDPARPWPLPALAGEALGGTSAGATCLVLRGADLDTVRRTVATADTGTHFSAGGRLWQVAPRPLLPDEADCTDL
ncbi:hypothetical protein [Micromonospora sp. NPDC051006]|uniref:hypothetical protein n=1 Tax=Micromonospora sp. NPDC051006 TaxID=3364283 RepID=UPI00379431D1